MRNVGEQNAPSLRPFAALYVQDGTLRRVVFEASNIDEALELAKKWGIGLDPNGSVSLHAHKPIAEAFDLETARNLLGGISKATVYRFLQEGRLRRVEGTSRVLITRKSIELICASRQ